MKQISSIIIALFMATISLAQVPQKMSYQAIIRDNTGALVANTFISMRVSLLQGSTTGTAVYVEIDTCTTNSNGLASVAIGTGNATTGVFTNINWANTPYFIQIETDITGGTNYSITGTQELATVPYAFLAGGLANATTFKHYIGELWGGGIVYEVYKDSAGTEHGLIVSLKDLDTSKWSNIDTAQVGPAAQSESDGKANTQAIINQVGHITSAALICDTTTIGGQTDWYLPSLGELMSLYTKRFILNKVLLKVFGVDLIYKEAKKNYQQYWNSTEQSTGYIILSNYFPSGAFQIASKKSTCTIRPIRSF